MATYPVVQEFLNKPIIPQEGRPKKCENCPFPGPYVGTRGPEDSPFVIVGESPGPQELWRGYPFVGPSGQMLEEVLRDVGWDPSSDPHPYIINAMQCLPRPKDEDTLERGARACNGRLVNQLQKYPRRVILALGNAALRSLTNNYGLKITRERGKLFKSNLSEAGIVAATHPAYLMRNGTAFIPWKKDLEYAVALLKGKDPKEGKWSPPSWAIIESEEDYEALVTRMERATHIAADTETGGHAASGASYGLDWQRGYILMLGITSNLSNGNHVDIIPGDILWKYEELTHKLMGNGARWIWQNGKFDVKWYRHEGVKKARVDDDTMLMSYCLNENKGHDLDQIAWDWIGADRHKDVIDKWFEEKRIKKANRDYAMIPKPLLYQYAAYDISKTYKVYWPLKETIEADKHSRRLYYETLVPASEFLTQMEMKGLKLDLERVKENDVRLQNDLIEPTEAIQAVAQRELGHTINIGSWQQLQALLYDKMKLLPPGSSTDDDHMIKILRKHPEADVARHIQKWRKISKARNTYVKNAHTWPGIDGRVHITFNLHRTTTGRLSSGDPTNLQNWPRDPFVRGEFVAEEGHIFTSTDLNQAELRCLAIMSNDPTLVDIYTTNAVSIHHLTSVALFGEHYTDDEKMRAKAVNFGIVYGRTAPSLAEEFNITIQEAEEYIRLWFERYPVARDFIFACRDAPNKQRTLVTAFGRKKRWGAISWDNQRNSENEASNFPHQSSAHDITLKSGIECQPIIKHLWGADFVNEIHDDIMTEVLNEPNMYGPMIAYIQHVMQRIPREYGLIRVPFVAEAKIGTRWGAKRNALEAKPPETRPEVLAQYMADFKPTEEHIETANRIIFDLATPHSRIREDIRNVG